MLLDWVKPVPPSEDKRWKIVEATMRRHGHEAHDTNARQRQNSSRSHDLAYPPKPTSLCLAQALTPRSQAINPRSSPRASACP